MMSESRLQRWSRKKAEASKPSEPAPTPSVEPESPPEEQELSINQALTEHEVLEKYSLPDPDTIELGTDITGFMRKEIPELLRRKALRALWKSNPVLAVLDGLNDYDEDFTDAATATKGVKTLYKVGQGLFDKTARRDEKVEEQVEQQAEASEAIAPAEAIETSQPEIADDSLNTSRHSDPLVAENELEPTPRYRPRMRFDY
ncbi:DUF3306 domain-containing protein [Marinobacter sp. ATCH36]|uniref:DUF3306 domain-containing protein n=1 Tax=Marinobacter sp. ATCH36 TaxID=2945106 RepID=UPI00201FF508|nr:DUF3306 domain-containing protein [Marinobacter sp. ATCH36]MCL7945536.1 DUF3306 domain-containing protein [Marinobacter sp. ATCH36]